MKHYMVVWHMDFIAASPHEAAQMALAVQRNPESIATIFNVSDCDDDDIGIVCVDLQEEEEGNE